MRRGRWPFLLLALVSCFSAGGGCPRNAGGDCDPLEDEELCPKGYYCSRSGICTKTCTSDDECRVSCVAGEQCGNQPCGDGGVCADSVSIVCQAGYCVSPNNPSDPYGPKDPAKE